MAHPLDRPVIIIQETTEENKLFTIINGRQSVYMRITPTSTAVGSSEDKTSMFDQQQQVLTNFSNLSFQCLNSEKNYYKNLIGWLSYLSLSKSNIHYLLTSLSYKIDK